MSDKQGTYRVGCWRPDASGEPRFVAVNVKSISVDESTVVRDIDDLRLGRIDGPDLEL